MNKIQKYIDVYLPIELCNLECPYCYVRAHKGLSKSLADHSIKDIQEAFSTERIGISYVNICADGETMLHTNIVDIVNALLNEGHYVGVVTNGTVTQCINKLEKIPGHFRKRLFIKFSLHYSELKRKGLLDIFASNVNKIKELGCAYTVELPAWDGFIPLQDEIMSYCRERFDGELCHVSALRDETKKGFTVLTDLTENEYVKAWENFASPLFDFRFEVMKYKYKGFCYAGIWSCTINLETGEAKQCYTEKSIGNIYDADFSFDTPVGNYCHAEYCYACHAFLLMGLIPELSLPLSYASVRDRNNKWLNDEFREVFNQKLSDNNKLLSTVDMELVNQREKALYNIDACTPHKINKETLIKIKDDDYAYSYALMDSRKIIMCIYGNNDAVPHELLWILNDIPTQKVLEGDVIRIEAIDEMNDNSGGTEVHVIGLLCDETFYSATCIFGEGWFKRARTVWWNNYSGFISSSLFGLVPSCKKRTLVLQRNRWNGMCRVLFMGKEAIIDTYSDSDDDVLFIPL